MKKNSKKILAIFLTLLMVIPFTGMFAAAASNDSITAFSVCGYGDDEASAINWWFNESDGYYYLYMPTDSQLDNLTVYFNATADVYVDSTKLTSGEATSALGSVGEYSLKVGNSSYMLVVLQSDIIPAIYIDTASGSLDSIHADKDYKEEGTISVFEDGEKTIDASLDYIKGRGNSTWGLEKKPYNIKFSKKTDLFGMGKAKKWSLIASADEQSLIRNKGTYDIAEDIGLYYSSKSQHVDLYINDNYMGNYLVCESVEIGSTRVDITDLEELNDDANSEIDVEECELGGTRGLLAGYQPASSKWVDIPNDPEDISGGYLIEFEQANRYCYEVSGFVTTIGQPITMKSPEYASKAQMDYISTLYQQAEDAVYSADGYNSQGKYYTEYFDMEALAKMYIMQELVMNLDAGTTSFYFYKDAGSDKLVASPVWDFDYSLGKEYQRYGIDFTNPNLWWAKIDYIKDNRTDFSEVSKVADFPTVLNALCQHDDFLDAVSEQWTSTFVPVLSEERIAQLKTLSEDISASAVMDAIRWNRYGSTDVNENLAKYEENVDSVISFLKTRITFLTKGFSKDAATIVYDANGGSGTMFEEHAYLVGEIGTAKENTFAAPEGTYIFDGWNTDADGSGKSYQPGDYVGLKGSETVLYAQWKECNAIEYFFITFFSYVRDFFARLKALFSIL